MVSKIPASLLVSYYLRYNVNERYQMLRIRRSLLAHCGDGDEERPERGTFLNVPPIVAHAGLLRPPCEGVVVIGVRDCCKHLPSLIHSASVYCATVAICNDEEVDHAQIHASGAKLANYASMEMTRKKLGVLAARVTAIKQTHFQLQVEALSDRVLPDLTDRLAMYMGTQLEIKHAVRTRQGPFTAEEALTQADLSDTDAVHANAMRCLAKAAEINALDKPLNLDDFYEEASPEFWHQEHSRSLQVGSEPVDTADPRDSDVLWRPLNQ